MKSILFTVFLFFVASSVVEAKMIRGGIETTLIENKYGRSVLSYDSRTRIGLRHRSRRLEDEEQDQQLDTDAMNFSSMSKAAKIWTILFCLWIVFWIVAIICFSCCDNSSTTRSVSTTSSNDTSNNNDSKRNSLLGEAATDNDKGESRGKGESRRKGKRESKGRGKRGRPKLRMFGRNMIEFKAFRQNYFVVFDGNHFHRGRNQSTITKQQQHQQQQQQQYIRD